MLIILDMAFLTTILYIAAAILILLFMITIHELGHYIAGKILGFKITEFAIGFGKAIYKRTNPKTGEVFSIRIFPIGGYCAFAGDEAAAGEGEARADAAKREDKKVKKAESGTDSVVVDKKKPQRLKYNNGGDFNEMPPWKRLIVLFSGAFANFVSAIFFAFLLLMIIGYAQVIVVDEFNPKNPESPAYANLLQKGDEIIAFNGESFTLLDNYIRVRDRNYKYTSENNKATGTVKVTFLRNGVEHNVDLVVDIYDVKDEHGTVVGSAYGTGISLSDMYYIKMSFGDALMNCVSFCLELSWLLLGLLWGMVSKGENLDTVAGTTGTIAIMAQQLQLDPVWIFILVPFISVNLAVFNLLPIPALDGARMVFVAIEWVRGRPVNQAIEGKIHFYGLVILFGLVIIADLAFWIRGGLGLFQIFCSFLL